MRNVGPSRRSNLILLITAYRDSSVGIATGWTARVRFLTGARDFYLLHSVQTVSGTHPDSYSMGTGGYFTGGKAVGA
jgi:hypothetical protein